MEQINALRVVAPVRTPSKRTSRVIMTDEARVLRELREAHKLSMRALGNLLGKSDSYISQVENGRMDTPTGEALNHYLGALGGMTIRSFVERVRRYRLDRGTTDRDELIEIVKRATDIQAKHILLLAKTILATQINF